MKKSISVNKKSRGRPKKKGGVYPVSAVRLPHKLAAAIDAWASSQEDKPGRSEAIRRLVELGLTVKVWPKQPSRTRAARHELAAKTIEGMVDPRDTEEAANRKQRLLKGPEEFQEVRVDHEKSG